MLSTSVSQSSASISKSEMLPVLGTEVRILLSSAATNAAYSVIEIFGRKGDGIPMHVHTQEDEFFYISEGRVAFNVDGKPLIASQGEHVFAPKNIPHQFFIESDTAKIVTSFSPSSIEEMFRELSKVTMPPNLELVGEICSRYGITFIK